jgi:hypothetical protein
MSQKLSLPSLIMLLGVIGTSPGMAALPLPHWAVARSIAQPAKTQCYMTKVCLHWQRRGASSPGYWAHPVCVQWTTQKVCEPHVYNNPNKPPDSLPKVRVPTLIAKPKPWQFQRQPSFGPPPSIGRSPSIMRR